MESVVPVSGTSQRSSGYLYLLFGVCFTACVFGGVTATLMSSYLPATLKDLLANSGGDSEEVSAIINSVYLFGMTAGGIFLGWFGDRYGRKPGVIISIGCIGLFTLLTSLSPSWPAISVLRFMSGVGVGGILVTTTILIAEDWPEGSRSIVLGIMSMTIPVGIFAAGLITYNVPNWRTGFLIGILPLLLTAIAQFFLRESSRWKRKSSAPAGVIDPVSLLDASILPDLIIACLVYGTMLIGLWAIFSWLPTWVQTLIPHSDGQKERGLSMMLFATGGLLGGFISGWVSRLMGVKRALILCFAAVFIFSFLLFRLNSTISLFSYLEMAGIAVFFGMSQGVLNFYIPDLFPTKVRSSATGLCFNVGRTFTATAVFFVGWLVDSLGGYGNALFFFSFTFLAGLIATLFAPEKNLIKT